MKRLVKNLVMVIIVMTVFSSTAQDSCGDWTTTENGSVICNGDVPPPPPSKCYETGWHWAWVSGILVPWYGTYEVPCPISNE